jgi:uncharacterized protein YhdP
MPVAGVAATAKLDTVNLDAWGGALHTAGTETPQATAAWAYLPTELQLKAKSLSLQGRALTQVDASLSRTGGATRLGDVHVHLQADQAQGDIDWQPAASPQALAHIKARLSRLAVPAAELADARPAPSPAAVASSETPPTLDIVVDALAWQQHPMGKLELTATGDAREWRIAKLNLSNANAVLSGHGAWQPPPRQRTSLDLALHLIDSGALLEQWGLGKVLRQGPGLIQAQLSWPEGPLHPDWDRLSGQAQLDLQGGQFLQIEPGAARLLGILSLQALPRRLTLDFRDVFQQGFAFDRISGDLSLANGVARTQNLRVHGVQAMVLLEGQSDLKRETQDLHLVVVPDLNAGTASLAYAAINPAIGLGTFLAQYILRGPLQEAGTREFHISGSWDQPTMEAIGRTADATAPKPATAASDVAPPAQAAASATERAAR